MNRENEKGSKLRFSIADFIIVLIVIACTAGAVIRSGLTAKLFDRAEASEMTVSFTAEGLTENEAKVFSEDKIFYLDGKVFGKISSASSENAFGYFENDRGVLTEYEKEGLFDVSGSFVCSLASTESGKLLNGKTYIAAGSVFTVKADSCEVSVIITGISSAE